MGRILVLLKKDWNYIVFVPILTLLIPLIIFVISYNYSNREVVMGEYGNGNVNIPYKTIILSSLDEGEKLLKEGAITAFYDKSNNKLYGAIGKEKITNDIYNKMFPSKIDTKYTNIEKEHTKNLIPFFCTIGILFFSIGASLILRDSHGLDVLKSIFTTPLKYIEYLAEKLLIICICFIVLSILISIILSKFYGGVSLNGVSTFVIGLISLIFLITINTVVDGLIENEDTANSLNSIIVNLIILINVYSMQNNYSLPLPISSGFYSTIILGKFPIEICLVLIISSLGIFHIAAKLFKTRLKS